MFLKANTRTPWLDALGLENARLASATNARHAIACAGRGQGAC